MKTFSEVVEVVRKWDDQRLSELEAIIKHQLVLKRRKSISKNYLQAKSEVKAKKLSFSKEIKTLKKML